MTPDEVRALANEFGTKAYDKHVMPTLATLCATLANTCPEIAPLSPSSITDCANLGSLFCMLVESPTAADLIAGIDLLSPTPIAEQLAGF